MKKFIVGLLILCCSPILAQENPVLVNVQWVKEHLSDPKVVLLQCSFMKYDYDKEHIPGARYLWPSSLAPDSPYGSYNEPDVKVATELLQNLGVATDSHVVLYNVRGSDIPVTARMFLTLENFGLKGKVSYMNGGLETWKKENFPVTTETTTPKKGNVKLKSQGLLVNKDYVLNTLKSDKGIVVDARMQRFYDGEPTGNPRDGHITGAKNIPYTEMIDATSFFKPNDQLQNYFTPVGGKDKELVTYCFIGQTASVVYMAGRLLGYDMKLYDGSLQEWSRIESLPMEKTVKQ